MTDEQIIEMAKQACAGIRGGLDSASLEELQRFAHLVRNSTLEEAAAECEKEYDNWDNERPLRICATAIRGLKP